MNLSIRNLLGYIAGITLFLVIMPGLMYLISVFFFFPMPRGTVAEVLSAFFAVLGLVFMLWSNVYMAKVGQGCPTDGFNVSIGERTRKLMVGGPYKYCRNPMLFGTFMFYVAVALFLHSYSALLWPAVFILYMIWHVKKFEEPRLYRDFGEAYLAYKNAVPMLFPFKK